MATTKNNPRKKEQKVAVAAVESTFNTLAVIDCNSLKEQKNSLDYLSWPWAWHQAKTRFPDTNFHVYENAQGWNYHTDGRTCWVKVGVTIAGEEIVEYLPVMDFRNQSIPANLVTSMDVNKAIQRASVKAISRHGLGLYIYASEDLPAIKDDEAREAVAAFVAASAPAQPEQVNTGMLAADFKRMVAKIAKGGKTDSGEDIKSWYINHYHPNTATLAYLEDCVEDCK